MDITKVSLREVECMRSCHIKRNETTFTILRVKEIAIGSSVGCGDSNNKTRARRHSIA